jgi:hypothetical protein
MSLLTPLRVLVPQEIRALLEKVDALESPHDSSYATIRMFVREKRLSVLERVLFRAALTRVERRDALAQAMHIVIYGHVEPPASVERKQVVIKRKPASV